MLLIASAIGWISVIIPYGESNTNAKGFGIEKRYQEINTKPIRSRIRAIKLAYFIGF